MDMKSSVTQGVVNIAANQAATRVLPAAIGQRNLLWIKNTGINPFAWRFNNFPNGDGGDYIHAAGELIRFDFAVPQSAWNVRSVAGLATTVMVLEGVEYKP